MLKSFDFETGKRWVKNLAASMSRRQLESHLLSLADGLENFKTKFADELIRLTKPVDVIPDIYREYRQIVYDGIRFLFSHFSTSRLVSLALDQLLMKEKTSTEERLITLIRQVPTLHKLGQIIARNRNLEPAFRKWLIRLENESGLKGADALCREIDGEIGDAAEQFQIQKEDDILAQASVGAVIPFTWSDPANGSSSKGVFKVIKPGVRERLAEELKLLDELAAFFDRNRERYFLKDFRFLETFRDIRQALAEEIDLPGERRNLKRAARFYAKLKSAVIPRLLQFSTEKVTAMEFMGGCKITDAQMAKETKQAAAQSLFKAVVWEPLFSDEDIGFFHGDPHAGNIYIENGRIILLDWSLAGTLTKAQKIGIIRLFHSVLMEDETLICEIIAYLSENQEKSICCEKKISGDLVQKINEIIIKLIHSRTYIESRLIKKAFLLIDQAAVSGIGFPRDLLLFRKSFFTLDGVLNDLDPDFDMDTCMFRLLKELFLEEMPKRWAYLMFPYSEMPENYRLSLSNKDLQMICLRLVLDSFRKGAGFVSKLAEYNARIISRILLPFPE